MTRSPRLLLAAVPLLLCGCMAAAVASMAAPGVGGAVRSGQKKTDVVLGSGVTPGMLAERKNLALSINAVNPNGQYLLAVGPGTTNSNVFSDMIAKEFLRLGYQSRAIQDTISEMMPPAKRAELTAAGFDMVLVGNLNVGMSTNYGAAMVGGEYANTGVTSFTVKGIDTRSGNILFIMSSEYGTAKKASNVAVDMSTMYRDMIAGTVAQAGK